MAFNEQSSETLAELAGRMMHHYDPDVRCAASVLTQAPDRHANAMGAHAYYNALAGYRHHRYDDKPVSELAFGAVARE